MRKLARWRTGIVCGSVLLAKRQDTVQLAAHIGLGQELKPGAEQENDPDGANQTTQVV